MDLEALDLKIYPNMVANMGIFMQIEAKTLGKTNAAMV